MNLFDLQNTIKGTIRDEARAQFDVELDQVAGEVPPRTALGDLAFPVAFELAKLIKQKTGEKRAPRAIAEALKSALEQIDEVARVEVAGAGYLNVFFDRARLLSELAPSIPLPASGEKLGVGLAPTLTSPPSPLRAQRGAATTTDRKLMVEHTSINPNKAAHIGHVRNSVIGDTFVNILRAAGNRVEIQNYIDNTGVQVADVVIGFMHIEKMSLDDIKTLDRSLTADQSFDYYCWDLYTRVGLFYRDGKAEGEQNPEKLKLRAEILHAIEEGNSPTAELADYVATRNVECILDTMERLEIRYDLLARESEILHLHFWERAFQLMKERGVIRFESEGKHHGCWVMPFESHTGTDEHESDKIIVRSNGTVTYTGKDIAYQLWKLGQLGLDFNYKPFRSYPDDQVVWVTTTDSNAETLPEVPRPNFGGGSVVYNVIDSRQSYPQEIVKRGVASIVPELGEQASVHLSYEMVALSPAACEELGIALSEEDRKRPYIEMSGRKGLGVKADDLINRLQSDALAEVKSRHPDVDENEQRETAHAIAIGALRYFLLKFTRNTVIAFDFKEALSFEGETGPYCQYAAVRANSIFRKLATSPLPASGEGSGVGLAQAATSPPNLLSACGEGEVAGVFTGETGDEIWTLLMLAARLEDANATAAASAEPAFLAKYTFTLAKAFNLFYHRHRIIAEEDLAKRAVLITVADYTRRQLIAALATLGITVPERM
ncbi:MAG TPA: arginine--tRNA ligase [Pyrinomonadaceae bacterium]|nr:arginine--tRNA ligase [Pyrinomonadaceae bacterium]